MRPSLAHVLCPLLILCVGCDAIIREPADGGGGMGGSGTDVSASATTDASSSSTSETGAGPTQRALDVQVVAGSPLSRPTFPAPGITVFSSDAQGALLDTTITDDGGLASLTVEDGGLVTAVELYVYEPTDDSPGSTRTESYCSTEDVAGGSVGAEASRPRASMRWPWTPSA